MTATIEQLLNQPLTGAAVIMGVLNVTPDSFSDGGRFDRVDAALEHAMEMVAQGAHIIDVGGESTRPGAQAVSVEQELERVIPVIETIRQNSDIPLSIDTSKPQVMQAAVDAGANLVNDVNACRTDGAVECCAELGVPVCLMHMQGEPRTMQQHPVYENVVEDVVAFLRERVSVCIDAGIERDCIIIDPGFGFGKSLQHNLQLLQGLERICALDLPLLVGFSRKSMFGAILDRPVDERLFGSLAATVIAWQKGARFFRIHDVAATRDALKVCTAVTEASNSQL
jgi:dihydropteroate synthase